MALSETARGWLKGLYVSVFTAMGGFFTQFLADPEACATWTWPQWRIKIIIAVIMGAAAGILYLLKSPLPTK